MGRRATSAKAKVAATRPAAAKSAKKTPPAARDVDKRLAMALAQQKAMSEILRVIAESPSDVLPVLDAVAKRAARLCDASFARAWLVEGEMLQPKADYSTKGRRVAMPARPVPLRRTSIAGRAALDRKTIHVADVVPLLEREYPDAREDAQTAGLRSVLAVPLMCEGNAYGAIIVYRRVARRFAPDQVALVETFARQAALAIDNVRLFRETREALEQQRATSEILRVISSSPTDVQPVFDAIAANALQLCDATFSVCYRFDGELIHIAALDHLKPEGIAAFQAAYPSPPNRGGVSQRAILTGTTIHIADVREDSEFVYHDVAKTADYRSALSVPMLRDGRPIGAISVFRETPRLFPDTQVTLLKTFADQAVIAIENVRLFNETRDALEQQTATAQILQAISSSPGDLQPVLDTVVRAAAKFCGAPNVVILRLDNAVLRGAAGIGPYADTIKERVGGSIAGLEFPVTRGSVSGRAVLERRSVHVHDLAVEREDEFPVARALQRQFGHRTMVATPLLREGVALGVIGLFRTDARPFSDKQLRLLSIFADQAVIAIENVRLFTELEARNRQVTEALEQQTATSEILRVISRSQTDVQPVFETIAAAALRLCRASSANLLTFDGELLHVAALANVNAESEDAFRRFYPRRPSRDTAVTRAVLTRSVVAIPDILDDPEYAMQAASLAAGFRSVLGIPLLREGVPIGAIAIGRPEPGLFTDAQVELVKTFADQAVIAIENVRLFKELEARNADLTVALEQQTATSEILRVISKSPTDTQPVFDTIVTAAIKLCDGVSANVFTFDGQLIHLAALVNLSPEGAEATRRLWPRPPGRDLAAARAILTCSAVAIEDVFEDAEYPVSGAVVAGGFRSILAVPLVRDGGPIGAITIGRLEPGPFRDEQIALLQTFADQAVIAIENVRLFKELEARNRELTESLEQQTATSEILRVIARSPTDTQPVFNLLAQRAGKLCDAEVAVVSRVDGALIELAAIHGLVPEAVRIVSSVFPMQIGAQTFTARAIRDAAVVHVADVLADQSYELQDFARAARYRSGLAVPIIRDQKVIGSIFVGRATPGLFADSQVELLKTFADQAVIAIENVRLFKELEVRNADLMEALEQQIATSDILRVISSSPGDVKPMLDAVAERALKLCDAAQATIVLVDGDALRCAAAFGNTRTLQEGEVMPLTPGSVAGRAIHDGAPFQIEDLAAASAEEFPVGRELQRRIGHHTALAVPLMREDRAIGAIQLWRMEIRAFSEKQVALVKTFADQAAIAIENVRLFKELEARTRELTRSVGELKALGEVGQAVSSTLDLETVLRTIVSRATKLAGMDAGAIYEYDEANEEFYLRAMDQFPDDLVAALRVRPIRKGEGALGRLAVVGEPVQVRDIMDESIYQSGLREILIRLGYRSLLAVPLLREDHLIGGLVVNRKVAGEFAPHVIELLKTFATQSALAIQNARLFREIEEKSRLLETASRHKSEFLANMSHELRTPLNAIIGFSEVLAEKLFGEVNPKQEEYLADILESGRHLLNLINDILDLSKIEAGRMELELTDFQLPQAIENALTLVRERAGRHGIRLDRTLDLPAGTVRADERKVKQVLLNLLSNAIKFTPDGGRVEVQAAARDGMAEISVSDTGVGIAPEDQETVFEEFRQVGSSAKKREGTGLGLSISRKIIELHGGTMSLQSKPGAGSTFTFTLPLPDNRQHAVP